MGRNNGNTTRYTSAHTTFGNHMYPVPVVAIVVLHKYIFKKTLKACFGAHFPAQMTTGKSRPSSALAMM